MLLFLYIEDVTRTNVLTSKFLKNLKNNFSFKIEEIITSIKEFKKCKISFYVNRKNFIKRFLSFYRFLIIIC